MENNWSNQMNLLKSILISTDIIYHLKKKNNNELVYKRVSDLDNSEKIDPSKLIYNYKGTILEKIFGNK